MTIYDSMYNWQGTTLYQSEKRHDMPIKFSMNDIIKDFLLKKNINLTNYMEKPLNQPNKKLSEGVDSIQKAGENEPTVGPPPKKNGKMKVLNHMEEILHHLGCIKPCK